MFNIGINTLILKIVPIEPTFIAQRFSAFVNHLSLLLRFSFEMNHKEMFKSLNCMDWFTVEIMQVRLAISNLFSLCPNATTCTQVSKDKIEETIHDILYYKQKTARLQKFSEEYLNENWTHVTYLHGIGKYVILYPFIWPFSGFGYVKVSLEKWEVIIIIH